MRCWLARTEQKTGLARALLPEEADEGDKVLWENYAYALLKG